MKTAFMIKYGKAEHLQQIVDDCLRFTPSQTYVRIEESQHNKGQGDLLEGKMKLRLESAQMYDPDTQELIGVLPKSSVTISIQDVSDMPIFCLSHYGGEYLGEKDGKRFIKIDKKHLENVKKDFPEATHALIILEPEKFVSDVKSIGGHEIVDGEIHYYDYGINTLQMYMFLTTGDTELKTNQALSMTYGNRYRHLLCKDIAFENQKEYRFICLDELIKKPVFYPFKFTSKYMLVSINKLIDGLKIE